MTLTLASRARPKLDGLIPYHWGTTSGPPYNPEKVRRTLKGALRIMMRVYNYEISLWPTCTS